MSVQLLKRSFLRLVVTIIACAVPGHPLNADETTGGVIATLREIEAGLSIGFHGRLWNPRGIAHFDLSDYGRTALSFTPMVNFPELARIEGRLATNFGTFSGRGDDSDGVRASTGPSTPYRDLELDAVLFQFLRARWREERFLAHFGDPTQLFVPPDFRDSGDTTSGFPGDVEAEMRIRDIELGLIGALVGVETGTSLEIGYFNRNRQLPMALSYGGPLVPPQLFLPEFRFNGVYLQTSTDPVESIWPLYSRVSVHFGTGWVEAQRGSDLYRAFGTGEQDRPYKLLDIFARLAFEQEIVEAMNAGVEFSFGYRIISGKYGTSTGDTYGLTNTEINYQVNLYCRLDLIQ